MSSQAGLTRREPGVMLSLHMDLDRLAQLHGVELSNVVHGWRAVWQELISSRHPATLSQLAQPPSASAQESQDLEVAEMFQAYELSRRHPAQFAMHRQSCVSECVKLSGTVVAILRPRKLPEWFIPPYEVDYQAFSSFGQGSFGSVCLGKWFDTRVVVKRAFIDDANKATVRVQFRREADVWFQLNHINIVKMYGACHVGDPFFVCEFASGGDLNAYLNKKERPPCLVWYTLLNAALGLQYLHDKGVVHGDLKADNILVGADDVVKLADFGLSVLTIGVNVFRGSGALGAYQWKAPECLPGRGHPGQPATFASDVFSFAMCIIQVATGALPWGKVPEEAVSLNVKNGSLPNQPREIENLEWQLIERMCCLDPAQRVTIDAVVAHLSTLMERFDLKRVWYPLEASAATTNTVKNRVVSRGGALFELAEPGEEQQRTLGFLCHEPRNRNQL